MLTVPELTFYMFGQFPSEEDHCFLGLLQPSSGDKPSRTGRGSAENHELDQGNYGTEQCEPVPL